MDFFSQLVSFLSAFALGVATMASPTTFPIATPSPTPNPTPSYEPVNPDLLLFDALVLQYQPDVVNEYPLARQKMLALERAGFTNAQLFVMDQDEVVYSAYAEWRDGKALFVEKKNFDLGAQVKVYIDREEANRLINKDRTTGLKMEDAVSDVLTGKVKVEPFAAYLAVVT